MALEDSVVTLLETDATLMAILTGGVWSSGKVGSLGITREAAPGAFGTGGWLKPTALVRQRALVPDGAVRDGMAQQLSTVQIVEVWLYEDAGFANIDAARARIYALLEGVSVSGSFPLELVNLIDRERDAGALSGASLARMDFAVYSIMGTGV